METVTESIREEPIQLVSAERAEEETSQGAIIAAAFVGTAVVPVAIGVLHFLSEISPFVKKFLTLHTGIGPYSGKVLFGYLAGLLAAALWGLAARRVTASPWVWSGVLLAGLVVGTALVFTPVVHWLVQLFG